MKIPAESGTFLFARAVNHFWSCEAEDLEQFISGKFSVEISQRIPLYDKPAARSQTSGECRWSEGQPLPFPPVSGAFSLSPSLSLGDCFHLPSVLKEKRLLLSTGEQRGCRMAKLSSRYSLCPAELQILKAVEMLQRPALQGLEICCGWWKLDRRNGQKHFGWF